MTVGIKIGGADKCGSAGYVTEKNGKHIEKELPPSHIRTGKNARRNDEHISTKMLETDKHKDHDWKPHCQNSA